MIIKRIGEFLKKNPIITILIVILLLFSVGFVSNSRAERYYAKYFKEQLQIEKAKIADEYKRQLEELAIAKVKAENDLKISKDKIIDLQGIVNGLTVKESNIKIPESFNEIQNRFRRLGYEANIINSNTSD